MRAKFILGVLIVAAVAGAYLAGWWSERSLLIAAEAEADVLRAELAAADARVRVGSLLGRALTLKETTINQNYGEALELSSTFFDAVLAESVITDPGFQDGLTQALDRRDVVTAALARGEPSVLDALRAIEFDLRAALGYTAPARPAEVATPATP